MKRTAWVANVYTLVLVLCAVVTTGLLVRRELAVPSTQAGGSPLGPDRVLSGWKSIVSAGHRDGPDTARVVVLVFADFECPACRRFATHAVPGVRAKFGDQVAIVFRHWPLSYHRFALPAARAAECASAQGRFWPFHDRMFAAQDSLGIKPFIAVAKEAGVPDIAAFEECIASQSPVPVVERDLKVAESTGAGGTPAIAVNGRLLGGVPDSTQFDKIIREALVAGRP